MKKIFTFLLCAFALQLAAQPVIDGKYLPVRGTNIKQVYDYSVPFTLPTTGGNQVWDYSQAAGYFLQQNQDGPYDFQTMDPILIPQQYRDSFPAATHASWVRGPLVIGSADSSYAFFVIDTAGLHTAGFYSLKHGMVGAYRSLKMETNVLSKITYNMNRYDTSVTSGYTTLFYGGQPVQAKLVGTQTKHMTTPGWGTLKTPVATFNDVMLAREYVKVKYDTYIGPNYQILAGSVTDSSTRYSFMRNNTFASSLLLVLDFQGLDGASDWGRYNLPADFGSITGTVKDTSGSVVTSGLAMLYRENSNFAKNDILAVAQIQNNGTYKFDSIPYGQYRISVRADQNLYPKSLTTYYGDSLNWLTCILISTFNQAAVTGIDINIQYPPAPAGNGHAQGALYFDWGYVAKVQAAQPIPGVDIIAKKNPGGIKSEMITNANGQYDLAGLGDGNYDLFVDIPGLNHHSTYHITIVNGNSATNLNFTASKDSIYAGADPNYTSSFKASNSAVSVFPNPFSQSTTIAVSLKEKSTVNIEVYNLLGSKVATLEEQRLKAAGSYNYEFKSAVPSGIYFVKLNVNGTPNSFKIVKE